MNKRVFNFSAGPAVLPVKVLEEAQRDLLALPGTGVSPLEISHRSKWFGDVLNEAIANVRKLLNVPEGYSVLFLQGGSRLQFSMAPINLLRGSGKTADYIVTGSWSQKAVPEAKREGTVNIAFDGKPENYCRLPGEGELQLTSNAAYLYYASNETIQGVQFQGEPGDGSAPLVCDASSDILSRPLDMQKYGILYACAQKNMGPAGATLVIIRDELMNAAPENLHAMLDYRVHAKGNSLANTTPVFAVYICMLVTRWLLDDVGGLENMRARNEEKAAMLYDVLDAHPELYIGHAAKECRSRMNVTFRLPDDETTQQFLAGAAERDLSGLKGHRSVGGIRASIYNAMPTEGVVALRDFMLEFAKRG
ncbi:MAG: 3-phosphoserine/phosphohydroxythreonine transaminase [Pirellulales bacterium]|nr:3-phosphoserine/phosphohydroxythreonine transaminase [Pirellulales bacterium]